MDSENRRLYGAVMPNLLLNSAVRYSPGVAQQDQRTRLVLQYLFWLSLALLPLPGSLMTPARLAAQSLEYKDFGQPPGEIGFFDTNVAGINSSGDVIGYFSDNSRNFHSFVQSGGSFHSISFPGSPSTEVLAINDSGQMVGTFYGADSRWHGFFLSGVEGTYTQIDAPGVSYAPYAGLYVTSINNLGQLAGYYEDGAPDFRRHAFLFSSGTLSTIGPGDSGTDSIDNTVAINNAGEILGTFGDNGGPTGLRIHGFLVSGDGMTQIDAPGAVETYPVAMNDSGEVLGYSYPDNSDRNSTYFLFSHGRYTIIDPPSIYSGAQFWAINDLGQVAGYYTNKNCPTSCGILLSRDAYTAPIIPDGSKATYIQAMNNKGVLAGMYRDASATPHIFEVGACLNSGSDSDGDGLCDDWEKNGVYEDVNGVPTFLDLPGMGADPQHKDIFVQLDTISDANVTQPALNEVIAAFANAPVGNPDGTTGINLHVDNGPSSVMNRPTGATWGDKSRAAVISDVTNLGNMINAAGDFSWSVFQSEKDLHFSRERAAVFHYAIFEPVAILDSNGQPAASGISRGIPSSDFIFALAPPINYAAVGGTFMHELGHNLGLHHGGADNINRKPNYLSVMNYAFQFTGLQPGHIYDYSRFGSDSADPFNVIPVLDESHLDEALGFGNPTHPVGINALAYISFRYCPNDHKTIVPVARLDGPIDWNCDGIIDFSTDVAVPDINGDNRSQNGTLRVLEPYDDWAHLVFAGGNIGNVAWGALPSTTASDEPTPAELEEFAQFWKSQLPPSADTTPPITQLTIAPQPNTSGWNNRDVTLVLTASDNAGGSGQKEIVYTASGALNSTLTVAGATASLPVNVEGTTTITYFSRDNAGNAESPHTLTIRIDKTPPTIAATRSPQPNAHGWNNSDVTVSFLCSDSLSGLAAGSPPSAAVVTSEGSGQSASGTCADVAGNSASVAVGDIKIDKTPPSITPTRTPQANSFGWNNTDVTVNFGCSDSLSGVDGCTSEQVITTEGAGQARTGIATDQAGNTSSATVPNINIDKTPPILACSATPNVLWPPNNKLVGVTTSIGAQDGLSGAAGFQLMSATSNEPDTGLGDIVGWQPGTESTSGQLRASRLGVGQGRTYTLVYSASDRAGNSATCGPLVTVPHDQRDH